MKIHDVRVCPSSTHLPFKDQLAFKLAQSACDPAPLTDDVKEMITLRITDNTGVALASLNRSTASCARSQALCHPKDARGSSVYGIPSTQLISPEWAAWANGTAVRELDYHDTYLAKDYSHPADNIPPLIAVAQALKLSSDRLLSGIAAAYEIQVALVKGICLHKYKKDHIAHLGPSVAAGLGAMLGLSPEVTAHAISQALHTCCSTRQSRKGDISGWKAFAPAFAGKSGIEATDRAMRGERSPSPIYEGEDGFISWMLGGPDDHYSIALPEPGEPKTAILETWTKEHSAEYQAQPWIDLGIKLHKEIKDTDDIESIEIISSHHTHIVIGTGSGDPQKFDPDASRETLDHSLMYIFATALHDGSWHHQQSYDPSKAKSEKIQRLWRNIQTREDQAWTDAYLDENPAHKKFGGQVRIRFKNGEILEAIQNHANAHPLGQDPFKKPGYIRKFETLTQGILSEQSTREFLTFMDSMLSSAQTDLSRLFPAPEFPLNTVTRDQKGLF